jgi:hypothetical protein
MPLCTKPLADPPLVAKLQLNAAADVTPHPADPCFLPKRPTASLGGLGSIYESPVEGTDPYGRRRSSVRSRTHDALNDKHLGKLQDK